MKFNRLLNMLLLVGVLLLSACGKDQSANVRDLLSGIPSDISYVAVTDIKGFLEDTDQIPQELAAEGVDPSVCAFFTEGYNIYLTGFIESSDKFKEGIEKKFNSKFTNDGEISVCGNVAVSASQFWICISSNNTIQADEIKRFNNLTEQQSFLSNSYAQTLIDADNDLRGWGDIKGAVNSANIDFGQKATIGMALGALYDDASTFTVTMDTEKESANIRFNILNAKGKTAKFLYPIDKIDTSVIENSGLSASMFISAGISKKMVEHLQADAAKTKGMSMIGYIAPTLTGVDGTALFAKGKDGSEGFISTDGHPSAALTGLLTQDGYKVSTEGNQLRFSQKTPGGELSAKEAASMLKGSVFGIVAKDPDLEGKGITMAVIKLIPDGSGMAVESVLNTSEPVASIILKSLNK